MNTTTGLPQPKFALVIVEMPKRAVSESVSEAWTQFADSIKRNRELPPGTTVIPENVWLIPLHAGWPFLNVLVDEANKKGMPARVLFCRSSEDLDWLVLQKPV